SVVEFMNVIGPLTGPAAHGGDSADAFPLVVPSIPGFGFSGPTRDRGWNVQRIARAWDVLMGRLGYRRYGAQGGDWGSTISRELGRVAPQHLAGVHLNMLFPQFSAELADLTEQEKTRIGALRGLRPDGSGYYLIQSTRPQTLAYGLTDSPAGQLAWITEKFGEWTDNGLPDQAVDRDQLLTNVTVYWLTATAGSSARLYYQAARPRDCGPPSPVRLAVGLSRRATAPPIRRFAEQSNNIVRWTEFDRGGHFAAMEQPALLVGDIREFFRQLR